MPDPCVGIQTMLARNVVENAGAPVHGEVRELHCDKRVSAPGKGTSQRPADTMIGEGGDGSERLWMRTTKLRTRVTASRLSVNLYSRCRKNCGTRYIRSCMAFLACQQHVRSIQ